MSGAVLVQDMVILTLQADAAFAAWRGVTSGTDKRIYDGQIAPPGTRLTKPDVDETPWPYATVADGEETAINFICSGITFSDILNVRTWVPGTSHRLAKEGYAHVHRILSQGNYIAGGLAVLSCDVTLANILTEMDNSATQSIARIVAHVEVL